MAIVKINMTKDIGEKLKDFRNQHKVLAKDVAEMLGKSAAYISKLEKGEIQQIEKSEFVRIVDFITGSNNGYTLFFEYASDLVDDDELSKTTIYLNFDWNERLLPIPDELIEYINDEINKSETNVEELVDFINDNEELDTTFFEEYKIDKNFIEPNVWYFFQELDSNNVNRNYIWMHFEVDTINKILDRTIKKSNYYTIYVLLYHLYKIQELHKNSFLNDKMRDNCNKKALDKLCSYKFYTLEYKRKVLREAKTKLEVDSILSKFDSENRVLTTKVIQAISALSDFDVDYTNKKLRGIVNNFEQGDLSFSMAYMAISLEKLNEVPNSTKHDFLKAVKELIEKYSDSENEQIYEKF